MSRVLVIIPAYNESETIASVLAALKVDVPDYDIVVVNDGSQDNTGDIVDRTPGVEVLNLPYNLGIGSAMQTGYKYAHRNGYDVAVQCDADGQHPSHQMARIVAPVEEGRFDMAIGSRYVADSEYAPSFSRRVGKSLLSRIVDSVCGGGVTDTTSGFRAANRAVIEVFANDYPDDYPEAEVLVSLHRHGLKVGEIPVDMRPRQGGQSSIGPRRAAYYIVKVSLAIFITMFKKITHAPSEANPKSPAQESEFSATLNEPAEPKHLH